MSMTSDGVRPEATSVVPTDAATVGGTPGVPPEAGAAGVARSAPEVPGAPAAAATGALPSFRSLPPLRYPGLYGGFVFVSSLDIILTWLVLQLGGREVNPLAAAVIAHWGLGGAIAFKFSLMLMVIVLCEVIGRNRDATARRLAWWSVGVSAAAPAYTLTLLGYHFAG